MANKNQCDQDERDKRIEKEEHQDERIEKTGQATLDESASLDNIHLLSIIGEVEGHDNLSNNSKTTKYEHILPSLAAIEQAHSVPGSGGKSFHRSAYCRQYGLFLHCAYRHHGDPSGADERNGYWSAPDL